MESLEELAAALVDENGQMKEGALRLRLSQQYVAALSKIYEDATIIGLPTGLDGANMTQQVVTALELYKKIVLKKHSINPD